MKVKFVKFIVMLICFSMFLPKAVVADNKRSVKAVKSDKIHILRLDNSGNTGNFIVLESDGRFALVDAGATKLNESESVIYPFLDSLGIKQFDFAIITHFDEDHFSYLTNGSYGGLRHTDKSGTLPNRYGLKKVIARDSTKDYAKYSGEDYIRLKKSLNAQNIHIEWKKKLRFGNFNLIIVNDHPTSQKEIDHQKNIGYPIANADSVGVVVEKDGYTTFIGGDIEKYDELDMIESGEISEIGDVDVFVMNHHGISLTSNTPDFLDKIKADTFVITSGEAIFKGDSGSFHKKGAAGEIIKMYSSKVGGEENILFNSNGNILIDFTDTTKGINVFQPVKINKNIRHANVSINQNSTDAHKNNSQHQDMKTEEYFIAILLFVVILLAVVLIIRRKYRRIKF